MDRKLIDQVGMLLLEKKISISCAESCTGGLFAGTITEIAGISEVFDRGIVTYSNRAKMEELGVKEETLQKYGAVSWQTAIEMAQGICRVSHSRLGISVTGVAGPGGGTDEKPVGLIYIGVCMDGEARYRTLRTREQNRQFNRSYAVTCMLEEVRKTIADLIDK